MQSTNEEHRRLIIEALKRVGRNILAFQQIESVLKYILPYMHPDGSAKGEDNLQKYQTSVQEKTLGHLISKFVESVEWDTDGVKEGLQRLVDGRNELVHHLQEIPGTTLSTTDGCRVLIQHLDAQYRGSQAFDRSLRLMALGLITGMRETDPFDAELEQLYRKFREEMLAGTEFVNLTNPVDTEWHSTRIVRLLKEAEASTARVNGLTSLARAGEFIKRTDPTLRPKDYGFKSWKGILKACGQFEVVEAPHEDGKGATILYRTKPPLS